MVFLISTLEEYFSFLDRIEPNTLFYALIIFTWMISLWEHYLSYRQVCNSSSQRLDLCFACLVSKLQTSSNGSTGIGRCYDRCRVD